MNPNDWKTTLNLTVASPCPANWAKMDGDERVRFCSQCSKHVYNLSGLGRKEVADLIAENHGDLCGRFYQRADGTVLYGDDCPVGLIKRQWRKTRNWAGAFASIVLTALGVSTGRANDSADAPKPTEPPNQSDDRRLIMGRICPIPSPSPAPSATPAPSPTPTPEKETE